MSNAISLQPIAEDVYTAPQLSPEAMAAAAEAGFKAVLNNRPDFEGGPDQPTSAMIEAAAQAASLLKSLPRPLLMFCRSGARSTSLYMQATALDD